MTLHWFLRQAWRWKCGLLEETPLPRRPDLETLQKSQWNDDFEQAMRWRLVMGAFRYKMFREQKRERRDNLPSIERHLQLYRETGNGEHLVDIANLALVEFTLPSHPDFYFKSVDDGDHHTELINVPRG